MIYQAYKKLGETPLEALERTRTEKGEDAETPMAYAGRLDPMAEGLMIVLSGEDVHRKDEFIGLDKTYTLDVLWGIETDTYDLLGIPSKCEAQNVERKTLEDEIQRWETTFEQVYPPYSSKSVNGKQLWQWARDGRLDEIEMPTKRVTIHSIEHHKDYEISANELLKKIRHRLSLVSGDFRQEEIEKAWADLLSDYTGSTFHVSRFACRCSSGTYMRSLANEMGKQLGCGACAFWIRRDTFVT